MSILSLHRVFPNRKFSQKTNPWFARISCRGLVLSALYCLFSISAANAQESHWTNQFGGHFGTAENWDNGFPIPGIDAVFDLNATYNVNSTGDHAFQSIIQSDGDVTFNGNDRLLALGSGLIDRGVMTVSGPSSTLEVSNDFEIGSSILGAGTLNIESGAFVTNANAILGTNSGNVGNVNLVGEGSLWTSANLYLGTTNGISDAGTGHVTLGGRGIGVGDGDVSSLDEDVELVVESTAGNGNLTLRNGSTITSNRVNSEFIIGRALGTSGIVTVSGVGSSINGNIYFFVGGTGGHAEMMIASGGSINARGIRISSESDSVTVTGSGSRLVLSDLLFLNKGTFSIEEGATATAGEVRVGPLRGGDSPSVDILGAGSRLESLGQITVQADGRMNIREGGVVSGGENGKVAFGGIVTVDGDGSLWQVASDIEIGSGALRIRNGGLATANRLFVENDGSVEVNGDQSRVDVSGELSTNGSSSLVVINGGTVNSQSSIIGVSTDAVGSVLIDGTGSRFQVANDLTLGSDGKASLVAENGGVVTSKNASIGGMGSGVAISDVGSRWTNSGNLSIGSHGTGSLAIRRGGVATAGITEIGQNGVGTLSVNGSGSQFETFSFNVGLANTGNVTIDSGGQLRSTEAFVGLNSGSTGNITVDGTSSQWNNLGDLTFGSSTASQLNINNNGLVAVGGTTFVNNQSNVSINGGRFEFGTTDLDSFSQFGGTSGSAEGNINLTGYNHISTLTPPSVDNIDVSEVRMINSGTIFGDGVSRIALLNSNLGELRTLSNQSVRFGGFGNSNTGEINNFGGLVEFEHDFTNKAAGFVGGRGQFIAGGGLINVGVMAFTAGDVDILGDVINSDTGQIISSGSAITTFFDDVAHNGAEIRTAEGSQTVFLGEFSGAGSFTGDGDVFFEGDLRPGNSPDVVSFEGDVFFGGGAMTQIEIAGLEMGEFDRLNIAGDLFVDGLLSVDLIDGFTLGINQEFLIADIGGSLTGQFDGLLEGDLVGRFGSRDLFISYSRGDGNDVALFSSVPEPGSSMFVLFLGVGCMLRRNRQR